MRLSDLFRGRLTWRELGVLIRQLPQTARTRLVTGDTDGVWGLQEHLTAMAVDELRVANWQRANEGTPESKQSKRPTPVERPGVRTKTSGKNSPDRAAARERALARKADRARAIAAGQIT